MPDLSVKCPEKHCRAKAGKRCGYWYQGRWYERDTTHPSRLTLINKEQNAS